jgi:hypothetical protein
MQAHLIAVQASLKVEDYRDEASFCGKIDQLTALAVAGLDDKPKLVAFPETIGFPLLLTLGHYQRVRRQRTAYGAAWQLLKADWRRVVKVALERRAFGLDALYLARAKEVYGVYQRAFSAAAKAYGVTVVAGTIFLPQLEEEASKGVHVVGKHVFNTAFSFSPQGRLLDRSYKAYLVPAEAKAKLRGGSPASVHGFKTPVGKVGVAICLDGFYGSVIDRMDGLGLDIVVQPSANHVSWRRAWPANPAETEESAWFGYGLRAQLQDRLHLRYGVNPMMVGEVFGLKPRGRSSLIVNTRFCPGQTLEGYKGLLKIAKSDDQEEIVRATVVL